MDDEGQRRCSDLDRLPAVKAAHTHIDRALADFKLGDAIVQVKDLEAGLPIEPDRGAAELQFQARALLGPQAVAAGQRAIALDLQPFVLTRGRVADVAAHVAQPRHPPGRVGERGACRQYETQTDQQRAGQYKQSVGQGHDVLLQALT